MGELTTLPNIAAKLEQQLLEAGLESVEQFRSLGSREAWLRIRAYDPSACINRLYALEGAMRGVHRWDLDPAVKDELKRFFAEHKAREDDA